MTTVNNHSLQVLFVDSTVQDYPLLLSGLKAHLSAFALAADHNGVEQISAVLAELHQTTDSFESVSIHVLSHAVPGCIYLGNSVSDICQCVSPIYACNLAAGDAGEELSTKLHHLMGATIQASTTPIGQADLGVNWELDVTLSSPVQTLHTTSPPTSLHA